MTRSIIAGLVYFVVVIAAGFALGALRVTLIAPHLGATLAVLMILWQICGTALCRLPIRGGSHRACNANCICRFSLGPGPAGLTTLSPASAPREWRTFGLECRAGTSRCRKMINPAPEA
jgi:hypothetical protein